MAGGLGSLTNISLGNFSGLIGNLIYLFWIIIGAGIAIIGLWWFYKRLKYKIRVIKRIPYKGGERIINDRCGAFKTKEGKVEYRLLRGKCKIPFFKYEELKTDEKGRPILELFQYGDNSFAIVRHHYGMDKDGNPMFEGFSAVDMDNYNNAISQLNTASQKYRKPSKWEQIMPLLPLGVTLILFFILFLMWQSGGEQFLQATAMNKDVAIQMMDRLEALSAIQCSGAVAQTQPTTPSRNEPPPTW
jgi:hypothetical protein